MDPVTAAWRASGSPTSTAATRRGPCARCLSSGDLTLTSKVVSENFTAFGEWLNPQGHGLCPACSWAYTTPSLRARAQLVTREPTSLTPIGPAQLFQALQKPSTLDVAIAVPSRAGRKHVLPLARWGRVQLDDTSISWTSADVDRLHVLAVLRESGATRADLAQAAPAWRVLNTIPAGERAHFLAQWAQLQPWRQAKPWLQLALLATQR